MLLTVTALDDYAAQPGGITGRPLPTSAGDSEADFEFVKQQLHICLSSHPTCHPNTDVRLPKRVLDVGPRNGSKDPYVFETQNVQGSYITLSHCWGGHVPLTLTTDKLAVYKTAIAIASLPPTFSQAVEITRKLGVRYLWIDSLCILQDSSEDWEQESANIGNIYGGSFLTIAARAAKNPEGGCFFARQTPALSCRIQYYSSDSSVVGSMYFRDPDALVEKLSAAPLDSRGWVLQEKVLSPRVVSYGVQQVYWECR